MALHRVILTNYTAEEDPLDVMKRMDKLFSDCTRYCFPGLARRDLFWFEVEADRDIIVQRLASEPWFKDEYLSLADKIHIA